MLPWLRTLFRFSHPFRPALRTNGMEYHLFPADTLWQFTADVFQALGIPAADAALAADVLAYSDLRGIDSHGVARLITYVDLLQLGRINPHPHLKIIRERGAVATVDGDGGLGLVIGPKAHDLAMERAAEHGAGMVSVSHSNHFGAAGYYAVRSLPRDLVSWAMTNSSKAVAPLWGGVRMLGTNPIAIAFPGKEEPPIVIDLATSAVAYGKIEIARRKHEPVPEGWCLDRHGNPTTDPDEMINGGALLPLGSDRTHGGHKGYSLAAMVDILCCVLSGANWGPFAPPFAVHQEIPEREVGKGIGHFFGVMDPAGFRDPDDFKREIDQWIRTFRATPPQPGQERVLIPGDPEREAYELRAKSGIPLIEGVVRDLKTVSKRTGVLLPLP
ncbi:Malate/lactate/ureidoglycolate dehydrogenase, LDH2 family [Catalinimonas alkaloidigena]|uniref:Malate/lactate/ureidoglycolate dehydrogenase, LDH2 family n=2 Tax=Catalinimonas alkaloidigena TaxID=1075417 RepID=A0A1G9SL95_9BACT|nr:Malate/lactate/ureidoglycolate dehydrogenase, LDH2 family [Catalinimonas alkaloidigena]